jgi:hypothetical protein
MAELSDSILSAQTQLAAAVDRTINALRSALRQSESVALAMKGGVLDAATLQLKLTLYTRSLSELKNIVEAEEDTANAIAPQLRP